MRPKDIKVLPKITYRKNEEENQDSQPQTSQMVTFCCLNQKENDSLLYWNSLGIISGWSLYL